ncbi:MAG: polysaccharide biosynthesis/export family protein [Planctomycetota bacterium]
MGWQVRKFCWLILFTPFLAAGQGCNSQVIRSSAIPPNLLAKPTLNAQSVDIASLGVRNIRNDVIYVGDSVECVIRSGAEQEAQGETWNSYVASDGSVVVPFVGRVAIAGQTIEKAEELVRQAGIDRQVYRNPNVRLSVQARQLHSISISGAVKQPGVYDLPAAGSNLVSALHAAGGILPTASQYVEIHDPRSQVSGQPTKINLAEASQAAQGNIQLSDGAVIRIESKPEDFVQILGNARANSSIRLPPDRDMRVLDALASAGGLRYSAWICDDVRLTRTNSVTGETVQIDLSIKEAMQDRNENLVLAPGDIINVRENPVTFTLNTIQGLMGVGVTAAQGVRVLP